MLFFFSFIKLSFLLLLGLFPLEVNRFFYYSHNIAKLPNYNFQGHFHHLKIRALFSFCLILCCLNIWIPVDSTRLILPRSITSRGWWSKWGGADRGWPPCCRLLEAIFPHHFQAILADICHLLLANRCRLHSWVLWSVTCLPVYTF